MALTALTAQLPGTLPDLFRRPDSAPARTDDAMSSGTSATATTAMHADGQRAQTARIADDTTRMLARHAALGPLTYGRSMLSAAAPAAAPIGMRGAHLDVRG
jgi:hypothetical protein